MKTRLQKSVLTGFIFLAATFLTAPVWSQVITQNIVGFINLQIYAGDNLIANQLGNGTNTLNDLLNPGLVANGATFTKWNVGANAFLPVSTYDAASGNWSINYGLTYGEGGLLHSSSHWTNTFVGDVFPPFVPYIDDTNAVISQFWQPNYANGLYLISSPIPVGGPMDKMFPYVTGRAPQDGEWVKLLDPTTQTYLTTTFHTGLGWNNGDPSLNAGEAAWFDLGPAAVPEPAALGLAGLGAGVLLFFRRRKSDRPSI